MNHPPTGKTIHRMGNTLTTGAVTLQLVQLSGDPGFYLIHLNSAGEEIADTYHDTIQDALAQAEWEFDVKATEWTTQSN